MVTKNVLEDFRPMVQRAFQQYTNDYVNERLKSAITPEVPSIDKPAADAPQSEDEASAKDKLIVTTEEEYQGFYIVRAILCNTVDIERVTLRDAQSSCAILFDNNHRKPICRLHFHGGQKYV